MDMPAPWHSRSIDEVISELGVTKQGLTPDEARRRLEEQCLDELPQAQVVSPWAILASQFKNVLIIILLIAVTISAFLGEVLESAVIAVIVLLAMILGFLQEFRAERAMEALRRMAAPTATVVRAGHEVEIPAREVVPGDVILLTAGARVPADSRLVELANLQVNEAALAGESLPVEKQTQALPDEQLTIGDRRNLVYSGTDVTYGRGKAIAVATGIATEFGRITGMLQAVEEQRKPLQLNLDKVGRVLAVVAAIVVLIAALGVLRGEPLLEMFIFGVALAVAVVPEALPAVVTISLAIGVQRMVKGNTQVRRLPTVETLGSTSVICSDKTGTLTRDEMTVREVWIAGATIRVTGSRYKPARDFECPVGASRCKEALEQFLRAAAQTRWFLRSLGEWRSTDCAA